uniref:NADH-ubiquinone oxidoreductase chain 5 n=1 Tax=Pambolus sp. QL-2013 TaxID=1421597 RepID=A0A0A6ZKU8_9HYME|nr:NADH dehydrogenase subunit 5 [Pambolus sp. QL-2013]
MIFFYMSLYLFIFNILNWTMSIMFLMLKKKIIIEWTILMMNSMKMIFIIYMDWMMLMFISTVCLISSIVIIYSINYMKNEFYKKRFMILILIFIMSMIFMISSPNMISILLGWDGLGLSSYCLVAFYLNKKSFNSSMITILMNRIGDIMILILISMFLMYGSWNFLFFNKINLSFLILLMIATITKSAQIPFSSWLPMAMAAPTPISSLVHSSTLVTAGVYLLIRFNYIMNQNFLYFLMMISSMTMFLASSSASTEFDFKKIIALSTLSQLGLMILTISLNLPKLSFFHLISHAMFKSLLFLCSGIIIHNFMNNQDIRLLSFLNLNMPFISMTFNIASLTLCGMPFLSGFYSKDQIIEMFLMNNNNWIMFLMMFMSMMFTIFYTFRLMFYLSFKSMKMNLNYFYKSMNLMNYSIIMLLIMSIFYGSILNWLLFSSLNKIFLPMKLKILIYYLLMLSLIISILLTNMKMKIYKMNFTKILFLYLNSMWLMPNLMKKNKKNLLKLNNNLIFLSDNSWLEMMSSKNMMFMLKMLFNKKYFSKLNFLLIMMMLMYLMLLLLFN